MRIVAAAVLLGLTLSGPAAAQTAIDRWTPAPASSSVRRAADLASWGTLAAVVALDTRASLTAEAPGRALAWQAARTGVTFGAVYGVKHLIRRLRPCAPDCGRDNPAFSFYSAHTAYAFASVDTRAARGPRLAVALPLAVSTGGLRVVGGKHWLTDTLAGAGAGWLASKLR